MIKHRVNLLVIGALAVVAAVAAWQSARARRMANVTYSKIVAHHVELARQLRRSEAELDVARAAAAKSSEEPPVQPISKSSQPGRRARTYAEWESYLTANPTVALSHLRAKRLLLAPQYEPFFRSRTLAPEQSVKLWDALLRYEALKEDLHSIQTEQRLASNDSAIKAQRQQGEAELRAVESEVLGSDGFAQLQDYERTLPARALVGAIAGGAALGGVPLSRAQADSLSQAIAHGSAEYMAGAAVNLSRVNWKEIDAQAQVILSSDQLQYYRQPSAGLGPDKWSARIVHAMSESMLKMSMAPRSSKTPNN